MVSMRDRALIEMRAKGLDIEAAMKNHWRQLLKADVVVSAFAVSIMLLIYYALVGFLVIYATTILGFTLKQANNLGYYCWAFNTIAVILIGMTSDRFRVRKPFMVVGAVGSAVMLVLFLLQSKAGASQLRRDRGVPGDHAVLPRRRVHAVDGQLYRDGGAPQPGSRSDRPRDLGLDHPGGRFRLSLLLLLVINTVTPLVNYGSQVAGYAAQYPSLVWAGSHGKVVADATQYSTPLGFAAAHPASWPTRRSSRPELAIIKAHAADFTQAAAYTTRQNPARAARSARCGCWRRRRRAWPNSPRSTRTRPPLTAS